MTQEVNHQELVIREAKPADETGIRELVTAAFGTDNEARLVQKLRHCGALVLEMVAVTPKGRLLGHIAYSRVTPADVGPGQGLLISCLAPMAVWPEFQRQGIGGKLIERSLEALREDGEDLVLVLGYPAYYPRFGFDAKLAEKVQGPYSGNAFMACALSAAGERDLPVEVTFATPFEEFE